jgi:phosphohistidine phosphatase
MDSEDIKGEMMKTLLLMRHAKSSWKDPKAADIERPLNKRGKKDAPFMGEVLKEKELLPQKILASTAQRVRETVEGVVKGSHYRGEIEFSDQLYLAEPEVYLAMLHALPETIERVMIIGHNPGLEGLLQRLSGRIESLSTGSVAYLSLPVHTWEELGSETRAELVEVMRPHDLVEIEQEKKHKEDKKEDKKEKKDEKKHKEEKKHAKKHKK